MLRDFGSHLVDQALLLFGPVTSVYAEMRPRQTSPTTRFFALAAPRSGGADSHLWGGWRQGAPAPRFRVTGTGARYVVGGDGQPGAAPDRGRTPAGERRHLGRRGRGRWGWIQRGDTREVVPSERGRWDTYYPAFAAAVRGEGPVPVDPATPCAPSR